MEKKVWLEKNKFFYEKAKKLRDIIANTPDEITHTHPSVYLRLNNFVNTYETIKFKEDNPTIFEEAKQLLEKIKEKNK